MQKLVIVLYKGLRKFKHLVLSFFHKIITSIIFYCNGVKIISFVTKGTPYVMIARGGKCSIGKNLKINNNISSNPIGRIQKCIISVGASGNLSIGDNVGMSFTAINCQKNIVIKNNVMIGGGTCIYDSDFHPLNIQDRLANRNENAVTGEVVIEENVFIGTNSTILKGVTIGAGSIIGACSVVTKNIPAGEIWAGNPARFIKMTKQ